MGRGPSRPRRSNGRLVLDPATTLCKILNAEGRRWVVVLDRWEVGVKGGGGVKNDEGEGEG